MILKTRLLALFISALLLSACQQAAPPPAAEVARPAKMFSIEEAGSSLVRSFPGEVRATDEAELAFRVSGELVELPATRGLSVSQGDLLARLDPSDYQALVQEQRAQYELAKSQLGRAEELVKRQLVSRSEYEQKLARFRVTQADLNRAQNNLDYTRILAPFDGIVARQLAENFESVAAGQVVLVLQTQDMLDIQVNIPESIISRVERTEVNREPEPVQVRFDSIGTETYEALYKEHETQADPATLTYKVTFSLPPPEGLNVLPGMSATVIANLSRLFEEEATGIMVPIEAVFSAEEEPIDSPTRYVWKVDPESMRASRQGVKVGQLTGESIMVLEGLNVGETIIAAGVNAVTEDMLVRAMQREAGL